MIRTLGAWGLSWGPAVGWAAVLFFLSSQPDLPGTSWMDRVPAGDKLVHVGIYAVLGACLAWGRRRSTGGAPARFGVHLALVALGALYGASDELHQSLVPGRDASALDWLADLCGVTLGYWAASRSLSEPESR